MALCLGATPLAADTLPGPTTAFSGTMEIRYPPAKPLTIRIRFTERKVRRDMRAYGTRFVAIVDRDRNRTVMMFPKLKKYAIKPLDPDKYDSIKALAKDAKVEKIGPDTIAGRETVKYSIAGKSARGRKFLGQLWLTPENIMIRMEAVTEVAGQVRNLSIEMRDLEIGPVDPAVFEIPADYEQVDPKQ